MRVKVIKTALVTVTMATCLMTASISTAQAQDIPFGGVVTGQSRCRLTVTQSGALAQSADATQLSSKIGTGAPGLAQVRATGAAYNLSLWHGTTWLASPIAGNGNTTFTPTFSGTATNGRGTTFSEQPGTTPVFIRRNGRSNLTIHLVATSHSGSFPNGTYSTNVILRCE